MREAERGVVEEFDAAGPSDPQLVRASQKWLSPRYQDDAEAWGLQRTAVWVEFSQWLFDNGLIETAVDAKAAFTNDYLPE